MPIYKTRPEVTIEAHQWTPVDTFEAGKVLGWLMEQKVHFVLTGCGPDTQLVISTLEGPMTAPPNWWIIKGLIGEFYACDPAAFRAKYFPI